MGTPVPDLTASSILIVSAPSERRDVACDALEELAELVCVDDMSAALEELSLGRPLVALIDGEMSDDSIAWLLGALGEPDRAVIWVSDLRPDLYEYGAMVQVPYQAQEAALAAVVAHVMSLQRLKLENARQRQRVERFDHVMRVVSEVRHAVSGPLTSLLAESELMLMDSHQLNEEQNRSLTTMQLMSQRIRDLMMKLQELDLSGGRSEDG